MVRVSVSTVTSVVVDAVAVEEARDEGEHGLDQVKSVNRHQQHQHLPNEGIRIFLFGFLLGVTRMIPVSLKGEMGDKDKRKFRE